MGILVVYKVACDLNYTSRVNKSDEIYFCIFLHSYLIISFLDLFELSIR